MPSIVHRVGIDAPVTRVHQALTTLEGLRAWWDPGVTGDPGKGGVLTFFKHVDLKVVDSVPGELVRWKCVRGPEEWMGTEVLFQLLYKQDQTFVMFTHADWKEAGDFMHHCSTKWATFLLSLKALIESGKGRVGADQVRVYVGE